MKPLKINMAKMRKVAGDKDSSTFLHENGHKMVVAHAPLPALQRKQLEKLPIHNYAEGTPEEPVSSEDGADGPPKEQAPPPLDISQVDQVPQSAKAPPPDSDLNKQISDIAANAAQSTITPLSNPQATQPVLPQDVESAMKLGAKGIEQAQNVAAQLSQSKAKIEKTDLEARQELDNRMAVNRLDFENQRDDLMKLYKDGEIKPNHYVENMSIPRKVTTAIGLMLGGIGSAYTHQGNPAAQFLNDQINRDIEGQKSRQEQAKTLLGENERYFKDQQLAYNATKINMNDMVAHQIAMAADKLGTLQAQAIKKQQLSQYAIQNTNLLYQNSLRKTLQQNLASGSGGQGTTADMWANAGFLSREQAAKEDGSILAAKNAVQQTNSIYGQLSHEQTAENRIKHPIASRENVNALNAQLNNIVQSADVNKRMNPETVALQLEPFHVKVMDSPEEVANKQQGVLRLIQQLHAGTTPFMSQHAPKSLPNFNVSRVDPLEGQTASGPNGQKLIRQGGSWAVLPQSGGKAVVSNGQ